MTFPTTGILDAFNRSNEGPPLSSSWTDLNPGHKVVSNQAAGNDTWNDSYWETSYGPSSSPGAEAYVTIAVVPATGEGIHLYLNETVAGAATRDGYSIYFSKLAGTDTWYLFRQDDAVDTELDTGTQEIAAGDAVGLEIIGTSNNIKGYHKPAAGSWAQISGSQGSDGTYTGNKYPGLGSDNTTVRFDDFGGGTAVTTCTAKAPLHQHITERVKKWQFRMTARAALHQHIAFKSKLTFNPLILRIKAALHQHITERVKKWQFRIFAKNIIHQHIVSPIAATVEGAAEILLTVVNSLHQHIVEKPVFFFSSIGLRLIAVQKQFVPRVKEFLSVLWIYNRKP